MAKKCTYKVFPSRLEAKLFLLNAPVGAEVKRTTKVKKCTRCQLLHLDPPLDSDSRAAKLAADKKRADRKAELAAIRAGLLPKEKRANNTEAYYRGQRKKNERLKRERAAARALREKEARKNAPTPQEIEAARLRSIVVKARQRALEKEAKKNGE